jgi:hypothetical protein
MERDLIFVSILLSQVLEKALSGSQLVVWQLVH